MKSIKKKSYQIRCISLLFIVLLLEVCLFYAITRPPSETTSLKVNKIPTSKEDYILQIKNFGPEKAYNDFKDINNKRSQINQHLFSHFFGEALYETIGIKGITTCDTSFAFGCYHSFIGSAVQKEGIEIIPYLSKKCEEKTPIGCTHALGHGIGAYYGYTYDNLLESLKTCDTFDTDTYITGCYDGVFMEYSFRTMLAEKSIMRNVDNDVYYPCPSLKNKYKESCYFWQANLWLRTLTQPNKNYTLQAIGELCQNIPEKQKNLNEQCAQGLGYGLVTNAEWSPARVVELCQDMSNAQTEYFCRIGAANVFFAEIRTRNSVPLICGDLDKKGITCPRPVFK